METLNNVATAATKAVFGGADANKEPVSGVQGDVSKGEPYDAGNLDAEEQKKVETRLSIEGTSNKVTPASADAKDTATAPGDTQAPITGIATVPETADGKDETSKDADAQQGEKSVLNDAESKPTAEEKAVKAAPTDAADSSAAKTEATKPADSTSESKGTSTPKKAESVSTTNGSSKDSPSSKSRSKLRSSLSQRIKSKFSRNKE